MPIGFSPVYCSRSSHQSLLVCFCICLSPVSPTGMQPLEGSALSVLLTVVCPLAKQMLKVLDRHWSNCWVENVVVQWRICDKQQCWSEGECVNDSVGQPHLGMPAGSDPKQTFESLQFNFLLWDQLSQTWYSKWIPWLCEPCAISHASNHNMKSMCLLSVYYALNVGCVINRHGISGVQLAHLQVIWGLPDLHGAWLCWALAVVWVQVMMPILPTLVGSLRITRRQCQSCRHSSNHC